MNALMRTYSEFSTRARSIIKTWWWDYNRIRLYRSLGNLTPEEYAEQQRVRQPELRNPNLQMA